MHWHSSGAHFPELLLRAYLNLFSSGTATITAAHLPAFPLSYCGLLLYFSSQMLLYAGQFLRNHEPFQNQCMDHSS